MSDGDARIYVSKGEYNLPDDTNYDYHGYLYSSCSEILISKNPDESNIGTYTIGIVSSM